MEHRKKVRLIGIGVLALLIVIVVIQNKGPVPIRFLFWSGTVPQIVLIPLLLIIGFLFGYASARWRKSRQG